MSTSDCTQNGVNSLNTQVSAMTTVAHPYEDLKRPLVLAHRGASDEAPENTYPAFALAVEAGADALETDVHWTRDGVIVAAHDPDVSRMTNSTGLIEECTYAELCELDFGYRFTPDGGESYPYRGKGVSLMRFSDLLREFTDVRINVDLKPKQGSLISQYIQEICEADAASRVMTASFHHSALKQFRQQNPWLATSASPREVATLMLKQKTGLVGKTRTPYQALQIPPVMYGITVLTEGLVKAAHNKEAQVHVWTVDETEEMQKFLRLGVDGIVTNKPRLARAVVDSFRV